MYPKATINKIEQCLRFSSTRQKIFHNEEKLHNLLVTFVALNTGEGVAH